MADYNVAFQWMMQFEDPGMVCAQVPDAAPEGNPGPCYAISGINSCVWPADFAQIAALPQASRAPAVQAFYQARFWNRWYAQLTSDDVAMRVLDFAVNGGPGTAVKTLQNAVNSLGGNLTVDGEWGPLTLGATNATDPTELVPAFQDERVAYYQDIVANNPADAQYLDGWIARAEA
jgi:lysozyme family protein